MCRFAAYLGQPLFLEDVVIRPQHSLVHQSLRAEQVKSVTNGDGFGLGWYCEKAEPALYRDIMPAWSDDNLISLCSTVRSHLFFAHVRAATGTSVTRQNCHPFRHGRYLFMHNGQIGHYAQLRRQLEGLLPDHLYPLRKGSTDSELIFLLAMGWVERGESPWQGVLSAFQQVCEVALASGITSPIRFSAALADGEHVYAFRLSTDHRPPSLYWRRGAQGSVVASEPLDAEPDWVALSAGAVLRLSLSGEVQQMASLEALQATH